MKTLNIFEKGDKVLIKGVIESISVDPNGIHKYQVRDIKSSNKINTWFTSSEIIPVEEEKEKENDGTDNELQS